MDAGDNCKEGYEGPLCGVCNKAYFFKTSTLECLPCGENGNGARELAILIIVPTILFFIAAYVLSSSLREFNEAAQDYVAEGSKAAEDDAVEGSFLGIESAKSSSQRVPNLTTSADEKDFEPEKKVNVEDTGIWYCAKQLEIFLGTLIGIQIFIIEKVIDLLEFCYEKYMEQCRPCHKYLEDNLVGPLRARFLYPLWTRTRDYFTSFGTSVSEISWVKYITHKISPYWEKVKKAVNKKGRERATKFKIFFTAVQVCFISSVVFTK
jgi:hypothetical protein